MTNRDGTSKGVPSDSRAVLEALRDILNDAWQVRGGYGFVTMRCSVAKDAADAYDVVKRTFSENEAAFRRLETSIPKAQAELNAIIVGLPAPIDCSFAAEVIRAFLAMGYCPSGYDRADLSEFVNRLYTQAEQIDAALRSQAQEEK